jgi:hypothetical protein
LTPCIAEIATGAWYDSDVLFLGRRNNLVASRASALRLARGCGLAAANGACNRDEARVPPGTLRDAAPKALPLHSAPG